MPRTPTAPPVTDPLADLRPQETPPGPPPGDEQPPELQPTAVHDKAWHDAQASVVVATWHADRTVAGLIHAGGVCGCWLQARLALTAVHGQPVEAVQENED